MLIIFFIHKIFLPSLVCILIWLRRIDRTCSVSTNFRLELIRTSAREVENINTSLADGSIRSRRKLVDTPYNLSTGSGH